MSSPECHESHCITCSDEAVPLLVVEVIAGGIAVCADGSGLKTEVMADLLPSLVPGDMVLAHAGVALQLAEHAQRVRP